MWRYLWATRHQRSKVYCLVKCLKSRKRSTAKLSASQLQDAPGNPSKAALGDGLVSQGGVDEAQAAAERLNLPLSPLMDPKLIAARERHRLPKPAAGQELSAFTKKLRSNPYALALASPVRCCNLTGLRLPEHFHLEFGLQSHPKTGVPWYLPRLASDHHHKPKPVDSSMDDSPDSALDSGPSTCPPPSPSLSTPTHIRTLSSTYLPARYSALRFISSLKRRQIQRLVPYRWKDDHTLDLDGLVWREDMDEYVLSLLRNNVVQRLTLLGARPAGYISACRGWDFIDKHHQVAAVLWMGEPLPKNRHFGPNPPGEDRNEDSSTQRDEGPPAYAMVYYRDRYVPAYNLPFLLGRRLLSRLETDCEPLKGSMAVLKQKHLTTEVQLGLWKLMGFLAPDGDSS